VEDAPPPSENRKAEVKSASQGILGYLVLAAALVLAVGVGAYLFLSSGDGRDEEPAIGDLGIENPYPNTGPIDPNRPAEGEVAPDFALVDARDTSKVVKLSDFRGKAVIVNWYASWCGPCKNEIPALVRAQAALDGELVVLGVDFLESSSQAVSILDEFNATYPAVLDASGSVADHYRTSGGVPVSFFIDKDGVLRATRRGELYEKDLPGFLEKVGLSYTPAN
jgi:thiol-disulfide isomerase/thioredoxin